MIAKSRRDAASESLEIRSDGIIFEVEVRPEPLKSDASQPWPQLGTG